MRLLHTSDWHLGRMLHRADLRAAQAQFLDGLVEVVRSERVDLVLVAGDIYDRAVPSLDAVELCEQALVRLRVAGARVVLISGNHDSARRLGFGAGLVDAAGVHLRTRVAGCAEPVLLEDEHGPVAVYGVPYLEPALVAAELPATARSQAGVLGAALGAVRADLGRRGTPRSVVLAHGWVAGGAAADSERDISVGGIDRVPVAEFDGFSYAALGHLHGPQVLRDEVRYAGSPLAYSFSEAGQAKGSWLVELGPEGVTRVEQVPAPVPRRLTRLRGTLASLLTSAEHEAVRDDWLSVVLTDAVRQEDPMGRLRSRFPNVLVLDWQPADGRADAGSYAVRVRGLDDLALADEFARHVRGEPWAAGERELVAAALTHGVGTEA